MSTRIAYWLLGWPWPTPLWKLRGARSAEEWRWRVFVSETRAWARRWRDEERHKKAQEGKMAA